MDPGLPTVTIYCRRCGYALVGLSEDRCPECGRPFQPGRPRTFDRSPRSWRVRWWRRRVLLATAAFLAIGLIAIAVIAGRLYLGWRAEQPAVAAIRAKGGDPLLLELADPSDERFFYRVFSPSLPLHESRGIAREFLDLSRRVTQIGYSDTHLTGEDVSGFAALPWIRFLRFAGTRLDDGALAPLERAPLLNRVDFVAMPLSRGNLACIGRMQRLECLSLNEVDLGASDLASLRQLPSLQFLVVRGPAINDTALEYIGQIPTLKSLHIAQADITDEGLRHLSGLTRLQHLHIDSAKVTGSGLVHLRPLPVLQTLGLCGCPITEDALACLKDFPSLREIRMGATLITDAAAKHLAAIQTLRDVYVDATKMTDGCRRLRDMRKDLEIQWYDGQ